MRPVIFFPISDINMPSSRYRVYFVENELRKRGYETFIVNPELTDGQKRAFLNKLPEQSILYIQKAGNSFHIPDNLLPYKNKHAIIFDFDDYMYMPEVNNMCSAADYIVCGSHFLYDYSQRFGKKRYLVECCQEQTEIKKTKSKQKKLRVVWSHCFAEVYADDVLSVSRVLTKLYEKYKFELILCGFKNTDEGLVKQRVKKKMPFAGLYDSLPVDEYNKKILPLIAQSDIAIVPFIDNESRKGKAGLSLRNYMFMGIPTVASPVGEHNYIIENEKNGFLACNESDWEKYLSLLLENSSLRRKIGEKARVDVSQKYSLGSRVDLLEEIFKNVEIPAVNHRIKNNKKACAVVVGRFSKRNEFIFKHSVRGHIFLALIEKFLLNTCLLDRVIFALPDDAEHRKIATQLEKSDINIVLGEPDDTTARFLSVVPSEYDYVFRFTLEKPLIDKLTLTQMLYLLQYVEAVNSADEEWGINVQGYSKKLINRLKSDNNINSKPLWQAVDKIPEFETCDVPFLTKPQNENVKCLFQNENDARYLPEFVLSSNDKDILFERYQSFLINKIENFNEPIYERIKNKKSLLPDKPVVCDISTYKDHSLLENEADLSVVLYQSSSVVFYEEKPKSLHIGIPEQEKDNFDFLDLIIEKVSSWCLKNRCDLIRAKDNFSIIFAVRLANFLNLPVNCYPDRDIDPKDIKLKHYLKMADEVFFADRTEILTSAEGRT